MTEPRFPFFARSAILHDRWDIRSASGYVDRYDKLEGIVGTKLSARLSPVDFDALRNPICVAEHLRATHMSDLTSIVPETVVSVMEDIFGVRCVVCPVLSFADPMPVIRGDDMYIIFNDQLHGPEQITFNVVAAFGLLAMYNDWFCVSDNPQTYPSVEDAVRLFACRFILSDALWSRAKAECGLRSLPVGDVISILKNRFRASAYCVCRRILDDEELPDIAEKIRNVDISPLLLMEPHPLPPRAFLDDTRLARLTRAAFINGKLDATGVANALAITREEALEVTSKWTSARVKIGV